MIRLRTFGEAMIELGSTRIGPTWERGFALALYLAVERERRVTRGELQSLLFPGSREGNASHNLRQLVYRLRRAGLTILARSESIAIEAHQVEEDFSALVKLRRLTPEDLRLIASGFLPGYYPDFAEDYSQWLERLRSRVSAQLIRLIIEHLADRRRTGRWNEVELAARACLALDPLNEHANVAMAESLVMAGSRAQAVSLLKSYAQDVGDTVKPLGVRVSELRRRISEQMSDSEASDSLELPLVGRDVERAGVLARLDSVRLGMSQALMIFGAAGIGKTRLVSELVRHAALDGLNTATWKCRTSESQRPLSLFLGSLPRLLAMPGALGCSPQSHALLNSLTRFEDFIEQGKRARSESEAAPGQVSSAMVDLLAAITAEEPLLFAIEDVEHLDNASQRVLGDVLSVRDLRVLVLLTAKRSEFPPALSARLRDASTETFELRPLCDSAASELLDRVLKDSRDRLDASGRSGLLAIAGGNPLHLISLAARHRFASDDLSRSSVVDLVAERISQLTPRSREVLDVCIALRSLATLSRVERVTGIASSELFSAIRELSRLRLLKSDAESLECAHEVVATAALQQLPTVEIRALHYAVASGLEREATSSTDSTLHWECADHWVRAGEFGRARELLCACSRHCLAIGEPAAALSLLRIALEHPQEKTQRLPLLEEAARVSEEAAEWAAAAHYCEALSRERALVAAAPLHDEFELIEIRARWRSGESISPQVARLLICLDHEASSSGHKADAALLLLVVAELEGEAGLAERSYKLLHQLAARGSITELSRATCGLIYHATFGDVEQAASCAGELRSLAAVATTASSACNLYHNAGLGLFRFGRREDALECLEKCYRIAEQARLPTYQVLSAAAISRLHLCWDEAPLSLEWHERAASYFDQRAVRASASLHYSNCIDRALEEGDAAAARHWLELSSADYGAIKSGRPKLLYRAYEALVAQALGAGPIGSAQIAELVDGHLRFRSFGFHDSVAEAVVSVLTKVDRRSEAIELLRDYVTTYRRDRFPLSKRLNRLLEDEIVDSERYAPAVRSRWSE